MHISFGEDVSDMKIEMNYRKNGRGSKDFVRESLTLSEAIHEFDSAMFEAAAFKDLNPLYRVARKLTGRKVYTKW